MILIDANLLIYAYNPEAEQHEPARVWLEHVLGGGEPVWIAWTSVLAFLRVMTNPRVFSRTMTMREAVKIVAAWLDRPGVGVLEAGDRHWPILLGLLLRAQVRGPLVTDAHLAALAIEHGATLCTTDRDFTRFPGLSVRNPLEAS